MSSRSVYLRGERDSPYCAAVKVRRGCRPCVPLHELPIHILIICEAVWVHLEFPVCSARVESRYGVEPVFVSLRFGGRKGAQRLQHRCSEGSGRDRPSLFFEVLPHF